MLDKFHLPLKDAEKASTSFKLEVDEISKLVKYKDAYEKSMQGMSELKLKSMCSTVTTKLGIVNRSYTSDQKINQLVKELASASKQKRDKRRQSDSPDEDAIVTFIDELEQQVQPGSRAPDQSTSYQNIS